MSVDWAEELKRLQQWIWPKLEWTAIMLGMLGLTYVAITLILSTMGSSSQGFKGYLYKTPPEKCYCEKCGAEIDMRKYGLYGKHCYEVPCPICGGRLWRRRIS